MSETHLTNELGWLQESSYASNPFGNPPNETHYLLGKPTSPHGFYPEVRQELQVNHYDKYSPGEIITTKHIVDGNLNFEPVNCLPLKYLFTQVDGTGISENAGVFTIDPDAIVPNAQRVSWTFRKDLGNSSENIRAHIIGNRAIEYQELMSFIGGADQRLQATMNYIGQKYVAPESDVSNVPIYPNSTSNSYKRDTNTVLTWDGDDMLPQAADFSWVVRNRPESHPVDNQKHVEEVTTGIQTYGWVMNLKRAGGNTKNIDTDFKSQLLNDDSYNTMVFQIYQSATEYKKYTFTGNRINILKNHVIDPLTQQIIPTYAVVGTPLAMIPEFKDGLNKTTFYNL